MLAKLTRLASTEIASNGVITFRLSLDIVEHDTTLARTNHRVMVAPGEDLETRFNDNSLNLVDKGYPAIGADILSIAQAYVDLIHTPDVIAAFEAANSEE